MRPAPQAACPRAPIHMPSHSPAPKPPAPAHGLHVPLPHPPLTARSKQDPKFVYYLSAEFLMGRSLLNTVFNLGLTGEYGEAVKKLGYEMEAVVDEVRGERVCVCAGGRGAD